jgi:hypothetical protein
MAKDKVKIDNPFVTLAQVFIKPDVIRWHLEFGNIILYGTLRHAIVFIQLLTHRLVAFLHEIVDGEFPVSVPETFVQNLIP